MPELIITLKGREIQRSPLSYQKIKIGRGPSNDISLPNESVSREHASLIYLNHTYWIESLNQSNGVWVNGKLCQQMTPLMDGDRIQIGKYTFNLLMNAGPSLHPMSDGFGGLSERTEALSLDDLQKYATSEESDAPKPFDQVRLERTQALERSVTIYRRLLIVSLLLNLYFILDQFGFI